MADHSVQMPQAAASPRGFRPAGWTLGLPAVALLWIAATPWLTLTIEHDIRRETIRLSEMSPDSPLARHRARAEVEGRDVRIVADQDFADAVRAKMEGDMGRVRGVRSVRTEVVRAVAMSPFELRIKRDVNGIRLAGGVPSAEVRAALVEQAAGIVPADSVDDRLQLAAGAPLGFAQAAASALAAIGRASTGEATFSDHTFRFRGAAPDGASYDAIRTVLAAMPGGFVAQETDVVPPLIAPFVWGARRDPDGVALTGAVPTETLRAEIVDRVGTAMPDVPLRDEMRTARGLDPGVDFGAVAAAAVSGLAALQGGRAELAGKSFTFAGESAVKARLGEVERRVRDGLPRSVDIRGISIRAVPASPFWSTARRSRGRVVLSGFVPGEDERRVAASIVAARFPGERLVDERVAADGAPSGFGEAERVALETLSDFAEGDAAIRDRDLRFTGRILYGQLAARVRETVPRTAPAGWTARIDLAPVAPERSVGPSLCGDLLTDTAKRNPIRFEPGKPDVTAASRGALDAAADLVRRCGNVQIRVVHHLRGSGEDAQTLATRRAEALAEMLRERAGNGRLLSEGVVAAPAPGDAPERTEFVVATP